MWAERVAAFDDSQEWRGAGVRDCPDWFVVNVGLDRRLAHALLRAGHCAQELPVLGAAFASGELSLDKMRSLSTIATAEDQDIWLAVARESSAPELWRQCREARSFSVTDDAERARLQHEQRFLRVGWDEAGMLRITGALPPEDGVVISTTAATTATSSSSAAPPTATSPSSSPTAR